MLGNLVRALLQIVIHDHRTCPKPQARRLKSNSCGERERVRTPRKRYEHEWAVFGPGAASHRGRSRRPLSEHSSGSEARPSNGRIKRRQSGHTTTLPVTLGYSESAHHREGHAREHKEYA